MTVKAYDYPSVNYAIMQALSAPDWHDDRANEEIYRLKLIISFLVERLVENNALDADDLNDVVSDSYIRFYDEGE